MKVVRIIEVVLLVVAAVVLTYVGIRLKDYLPWLIAVFGIGFVLGVMLTVLISRGLRSKKEIPAPAPKDQKTA